MVGTGGKNGRHRLGLTILAVLLIVPLTAGVVYAQTTVVWWNPDGWAVYPALAEKFMQANPDVFVEVVAVPEEEFLDKFFLAMASGTNPPDVFTWYFPANIGRHTWVEDLTPYMERDGLVPEDVWFPISLERARFQDRYYAVPRDVSPGGMAYNKNLLDRLGLAYPGDDYDIEQFERDLRLSSRPDMGILPINNEMIGPGALMWTFLAASLDVQYISEDGLQTIGYMDAPKTLSAFEWWAELHKQEVIPAQWVPFWEGNVAFGSAAMWELIFAVEATFDWGLHPGPIGSGPRQVYADSVLYYMYSGSQNKEAAWRLMNWLSTSLEAGGIIAQYMDYAPPMREAWFEYDLINDPVIARYLEIAQLPAETPNYLRTEHMWEVVAPAIWQAWELDVNEGTASIVSELREAARTIQIQLDELNRQ